MTNIEMLTRLENVNTRLEDAENYVTAQKVCDARCILADVLDYLREQVVKENNKKQKTTNVLRAAKKIIKSISYDREWLKGVYIDDDGNEHITNGFIGIISYKPLGLPKAEKGMDLNSHFPITDTKIKLPTLAELNNQIKEFKTKIKAREISKYASMCYKFNDEIYVNAEYLAIAIDASGAEYAEYDSRKIETSITGNYVRSLTGVLIFSGKNAKVIVMPLAVRKSAPAVSAENNTIVANNVV